MTTHAPAPSPRPSRWQAAVQRLRRRWGPVGDKPRAPVRWICDPLDGLPRPVSNDPDIDVGWAGGG